MRRGIVVLLGGLALVAGCSGGAQYRWRVAWGGCERALGRASLQGAAQREAGGCRVGGLLRPDACSWSGTYGRRSESRQKKRRVLPGGSRGSQVLSNLRTNIVRRGGITTRGALGAAYAKADWEMNRQLSTMFCTTMSKCDAKPTFRERLLVTQGLGF